MTTRDLLTALCDRGDELLLSIARGETQQQQLHKRNQLARIIKRTKEHLSPKEES